MLELKYVYKTDKKMNNLQLLSETTENHTNYFVIIKPQTNKLVIQIIGYITYAYIRKVVMKYPPPSKTKKF